MSKEEQPQKALYSQNIIEFVTVAAEFIATMERPNNNANLFLDRMLKISSLLYLKATLLPNIVCLNTDKESQYVTEDLYNQVKNKIAELLGDKDDYLETFNPEMQYSETPIPACISENLADVYQDIKDMVLNFQTANEEVMENAIETCTENFKTIWGQKLLNSLGAMHNVYYSASNEFDIKDTDDLDK